MRMRSPSVALKVGPGTRSFTFQVIKSVEAFNLTEQITGKKMIYEYVDENRSGDHICYYSDLSKMKEHYPEFGITKDLSYIIENIVTNETKN